MSVYPTKSNGEVQASKTLAEGNAKTEKDEKIELATIRKKPLRNFQSCVEVPRKKAEENGKVIENIELRIILSSYINQFSLEQKKRKNILFLIWYWKI